mmetsp:Transcript_4458/g.10696  ORF Transcript_4458/g.10696 Transcript_4458/m.10696 type:complete len:481 (+) Transcript_4458:241-1683(+)
MPVLGMKVESLVEYVSRTRPKADGPGGGAAEQGWGSPQRDKSYHSMGESEMFDKSAGGGRSFHGTPNDHTTPSSKHSHQLDPISTDVDVTAPLSETASHSAHTPSSHPRYPSLDPSSLHHSPHASQQSQQPTVLMKSDSAGSLSRGLIGRMGKMPLHVRGRAEAWETPREQIKMMEKLGEGETGCVYKCRWRGLDCAAKILTVNSRNTVAYHDMVNEVSTVSHLRHPNLVLFLGACTTGDEPLLILNEYMAGGNLEDRFSIMWKHLGHPWRPSRIQAAKWIKDLTRAMVFLHNCHTPIVHRDLKPANLLLTDEDQLKVADFGLCKTLLKVQEDGTPYTMTGKTGTMRYMAPEVVRSEPHYNEKVDIYSMAMIFWFICHGQRPFEGVQPELVADLTSSRGMRPSMEALNWPELAPLVDRMWGENPKDRPSSAEILEELGKFGKMVPDGKSHPLMPKSLNSISSAFKDKAIRCSIKCTCAVM